MGNICVLPRYCCGDFPDRERIYGEGSESFLLLRESHGREINYFSYSYFKKKREIELKVERIRRALNAVPLACSSQQAFPFGVYPVRQSSLSGMIP